MVLPIDPTWILGIAIGFALISPFLFVFATWDHEIFRQYPLLPGPLDWGSKEFIFRCWISRWVRTGWSSRMKLLAPCPRIALQTKFTILDAEIANVKASLGASTENITDVPLVFPQVICSYLLVQLLGNSHFPCPVDSLQWKRLHITQLRRIDVTEELNCLMVLIDKKMISEGIEFTVQTDLFDEAGVVWQSSLYFVVPHVHSSNQAIPITQPSNPLDQTIMHATDGNKIESLRLSCSVERMIQFNMGGAVNIEHFSPWGKLPDRVTPLWAVAAVCSAIEKEENEIAYPIVCHCAAESTFHSIQDNSELICEYACKTEEETTNLITFNVKRKENLMMAGYLRSVGWKYVSEDAEEMVTED